MRRLPPEVDQLLWTLAETGSAQAVEEFEARYPQYRYELGRRMTMVRGLKGEKVRAEKAQAIPTFRPRPLPSRANPRALAWTGALVLAALAAASYTLTTTLSAPPEPRPDPRPAPVAQTEVKPAPAPPEPAPHRSSVVENAPKPPPETDETPDDVKPDATPAYLRPQTVKMKRAPLVDALKVIAMQGGLKIVMGPGMPNPDIAVDYEGKNTIEILQDLGRQYAFTPFDQGDGSVLIIPARDDGAPAKPADGAHPGEVFPNRRIGP